MIDYTDGWHMAAGRRWWAWGVAAAVLVTGSPAVAAPPRDTVAWHACALGPEDPVGTDLDAVGARCGEVTVPLDHRAPGGRTITVAVARRPATDPTRRIGTLVVNTGGPGASIDAVSFLAHAAPEVAERYDVVGVDPRFFGRSTPLDCGWPTTDYLRGVAQLATPDRAAFDRSVAASRALAARCAPHRDELAHASTRAIARDLDLVRAALGERRISFLGWSYGTYLGAVYLQLFPGRTARTVLDSPLDPGAYGPGVTRETGPADAAALRDWARWAARHDAEYHLGATADRVLATVDTVHRAARRQPLRVGAHTVDADLLPGLLLTADDSDETYADLSAQVVVYRDAARGATVTPTPLQEQKLAIYDSAEVIPDLAIGVANQCADRAASRDPQTYYRDIRAHLADEPFFGPLARHIGPCAFWPTDPVEPPTVVASDAPALLIGASGDPAAPLQGQLALHRALTGSQMITLSGAYRHGVHLFADSACVRTAVNRYLIDGSLPDRDVFC